VLLPQLVQALYGYDAYTAGLILSPGGIAVMVCMPLSGLLLSRGVDARYLIGFGVAAGLAALPAALYGAAPFFRGAWGAARAGVVGIDAATALVVAVGMVAIEDKLGVAVSEQELLGCDTVGDLEQVIRAKVPVGQ